MSPTRARPIVAIDGPAGAGKSTVARKLADVLGFVLVDTGAMYRAVALAAMQANVPWGDAEATGRIAEGMVASESLRFDRSAEGEVRVFLGGQDVSSAIRTADIGMGASQVSAHPQVRAALLAMQRQAGRDGGVVLEGRDIGTVVFPDADFKAFLTARPEVRARRRFEELSAKGQKVTVEQILAETIQRDEQDSGRAHAPLRQAADAVLVDSSDVPAEEVVASLAQKVRRIMGMGETSS